MTVNREISASGKEDLLRFPGSQLSSTMRSYNDCVGRALFRCLNCAPDDYRERMVHLFHVFMRGEVR